MPTHIKTVPVGEGTCAGNIAERNCPLREHKETLNWGFLFSGETYLLWKEKNSLEKDWRRRNTPLKQYERIDITGEDSDLDDWIENIAFLDFYKKQSERFSRLLFSQNFFRKIEMNNWKLSSGLRFFLKKTLEIVENLHRTIVVFDMSDDEYKYISGEARKNEEYIFLCFDSSKKKSDGKFTIWNESEDLYRECIQKTNFSV